jgi:Putative silver efflux pump
MIESIIRWSVYNRFLVLLATLLLVGGGLFSLKNTPVDALPDLSDVQVIIKTNYAGQAPQVVEDQVTYPPDHGHAVRTRRQDRAWLFVLRGLLRLRDF